MADALFGFFGGKRGRKKRSKLDLKRKFFTEKPTTEHEDIHQTCLKECYSWLKPSADIIENILKRLNVGDRIRLSIVSKHWNSIVTRRDIRGAPHELPWLLLPHPRRWERLSFLNLSKGKLVKLKLPKPVEGGWVYGSNNKGSLIIVKEQELESAMFLVNPISGALHKLPPFKTIPCFQEFIKTREWKRYGAIDFCPRIAVDSIDSNNWMMAAAVLSDRKTLGLCRPGDKTWSVFQVIDNDQEGCLVVDILFSCGTLYALLQNHQRDDEVHATQTLKSGDNSLEVKLKFVLDKYEILNENIDEDYGDHVIVHNSTYRSWLSESIDNEVLVVHQMKYSCYFYEGNHEDDNAGGNALNNQEFNNDDGGLNVVDKYDDYDEDIDSEGIHDGEEIYDEYNGDEEDIHQDHADGYDHVEENQQAGEQVGHEDVRPYLGTCSFRAYKIDQCKNKLVALQCLGDQLLFLGEGGSFSLPANDFKEPGNNCIYFATNFVQGWELAANIPIYPEIGIFYLDPGSNEGRIEWPVKAPSINVCMMYQPTWFIPYF